jgi:site-specific DNA-methyltransferase (adenine-specific)
MCATFTLRGKTCYGPPRPGGYVSRFFYCSKADTPEREDGCEDLPAAKQDESREEGAPGGEKPRNRGAKTRHNLHPTVKPLRLMEWLLTLVQQPEDNLIFDPFLGSGTTLLAALRLGLPAVGIEREEEYVKIAQARLTFTLRDSEGI